MNIWKTKVWKPIDIACLKWSSLLIGIVVGSLLAEMAKPYIVPMLIAAAILAIKPMWSYFSDDKPTS